MNSCQIVRVTPTSEGVALRIWVDDEMARHVCVAEAWIPKGNLRIWLADVADEEEYADQQQLTFDD